MLALARFARPPEKQLHPKEIPVCDLMNSTHNNKNSSSYANLISIWKGLDQSCHICIFSSKIQVNVVVNRGYCRVE
jgi:hypothetical protein